MSIRKIDKVSCSLNLGYIYDLNYSFAPEQGVTVSLFFVNESGSYNLNNIISPTRKVQIKIGKTLFNLFAAERELEISEGRRVLRVDFIDETFTLDNYYIGLTNRACGPNVFTLGRPVDNRTDAEKARDGDAEFKVKAFTQLDDVEYNFDEFISILRKIYPVEINADYDRALTRSFVGTFRDVLTAWCSYYNLSYFFENSVLKIYDPTKLNINFPSIPEDAISYSDRESGRNTYNKTAWNYFSQEGGERGIGADNNYYLISMPFYPAHNIFGLQQDQIDLNQVVAASYGKEFWFCYNYFKGTAEAECGWYQKPISEIPSSLQLSIRGQLKLGQSISDITFATIDEKIFESKFEMYYQYGQKIAGKYYFSNTQNNIDFLDNVQFYEQNNIRCFTKDCLLSQNQIKPEKFVTKGSLGQSLRIESTNINDYFLGLKCTSSRLYFVDDKKIVDESNFEKSESEAATIKIIYDQLTNPVFGSDALNFTDIYSSNRVYFPITLPSNESSFFFSKVTPSKIKLFDYRYKIYNTTGYDDGSNRQKEEEDEFDKTEIVSQNTGPLINSNIGTLKARRNSDLVLYYSKYEKCQSEGSNGVSFGRKFIPVNPSVQIPVVYTLQNQQAGYKLTRDFSYVDLYCSKNTLQFITKPYLINERTVSFTLNYFTNDIPTSFISNGLVGLSVSVSSNGISASYTYANTMLRVPESDAFIEKLEQSIKNSWISKYEPLKKIKDRIA